HSWWHTWGESTLWVAAIITALGAISRTKPLRWLFRTLVSRPVTEWGSKMVGDVVDTKVTNRNGGSSLRDQLDDLATAVANIHACIDRRATETHDYLDKVMAYSEEVLAEAIGARQRIRHLYRALDMPVFETD